MSCPSAVPIQSKSCPQLTARALFAQCAANTMSQARSLLRNSYRDLNRRNAANKAKRSAQPGARPMITTNLIAADIELGEQSADDVGLA